MTLAMRDGLIQGMFFLGQNAAVGGSNSHLVQRGLAELDWMVVHDFSENETAEFWRTGPLIESGELGPEDIKTEIFLMPAALSAEKSGTYTNLHRLIQWHDKVVDPPGDSRSESWFIYHLGRRLKALYAESERPSDAPIRNLTWDYPTEGWLEEPSGEAVLKAINGYTWADRRQVEDYQALKDDGSTACGAWLYSGIFPAEGENKARSRRPDGPDGPGTHLGWAFAWPSHRRTLVNRASANAAGAPWSEKKRLMWWNQQQGRWAGPDVVDFEPTKAPGYDPDWNSRPEGMDALDGRAPFIMIADGRSALFAPSGLKDAPLPTDYEPVESPVRNPLYAQQHNPSAKLWRRADNPLHEVGDPRFPHVLTTYRLTEHHSAATSTRSVPSTAELQPEGFAEMPPELAAELGLGQLDWIVLSTARGEIETRTLVTERLRPFVMDGGRLYQIGMPWHYGWVGYATGDIANVPTAVIGDPNTSMHENKALTCGLRAGRLARPPAKEPT